MSSFSMIDTLQFSERLIQAGMAPEIAKELAKAHKETFDDSLLGTVATKTELFRTEAALKEEIIRVETDLHHEIRRVETDLRHEITEVRHDIILVKSELKQDIQQLKSSDVLIKWMIGFLLTINITILAKMFV